MLAAALCSTVMGAPAKPEHATTLMVGESGDDSTTLLRHKKFLGTHDSATGYITPANLLKIKSGLGALALAAESYVKTQDVDLPGQMDCGARFIDLRIGKETAGGPVSLHHALVFIPDTEISTVGPGWIEWANNNPSELVLMQISHCYEGSKSVGCDDSFYQPFRDLGINVVEENVSELTVKEAMDKSKLKGGGHILGILGNAIPDSWPGEDCGTVSIYGDAPLAAGAADTFCSLAKHIDSRFAQQCSAQTQCKKGPILSSPGCDASCFTHLEEYAKGIMTSGIQNNKTSNIQWMWQETLPQILSFGAAPAILSGVQVPGANANPGAFYSIVSSTARSGINKHLVDYARSGALDQANIMMVNQINNRGPDAAAALGSASIKANTCPQKNWRGKICDTKNDCGGTACARPSAETDALVCCPSGQSTAGPAGVYCTDMPAGSYCYTDAMCASGKCSGSLLSRGKCVSLDTCYWDTSVPNDDPNKNVCITKDPCYEPKGASWQVAGGGMSNCYEYCKDGIENCYCGGSELITSASCLAKFGTNKAGNFIGDAQNALGGASNEVGNALGGAAKKIGSWFGGAT